MGGELEKRLSAASASVERELSALLGDGAARPTEGVLHVCSCVEGEDGTLLAIRVGPAAPQSELDGFVLRAARAQADAIVTSGSILRSEPALRHALGADATGRALQHYRRHALGKVGAPLNVVLSESGELPRDHPLWAEGAGALVWTAPSQVSRLRGVLPMHVDVEGAPERGPAALLAVLRARGLASVDLEVGPSAVAPFYRERLVDALWCGRVLEADAAGDEVRGGAWPFDVAQVEAWRVGGSGPIEQASGPWRFDACRPA